MKKGWGLLVIFPGLGQCFEFPLVLQHCWLGDWKGIWSVTSCATYPEGSLLEQMKEETEVELENRGSPVNSCWNMKVVVVVMVVVITVMLAVMTVQVNQSQCLRVSLSRLALPLYRRKVCTVLEQFCFCRCCLYSVHGLNIMWLMSLYVLVCRVC